MLNNVSFALLLALLAGLSTGIGSIIAYFMRKPKDWQLSLILGFSAGVMVYISFAELLYAAIDKVGFVTANLGFFVGIAFIAIVDILVPHEYKQEHVGNLRYPSVSQNKTIQGSDVQPPASLTVEQRSNLRRAGMLIAFGIAIHNFPEGLAVFSGAVTGDWTLGMLVAVAIALHNIPEGISVSIPIAEATGNRRMAFVYSFLAGLAEPVGAIIGYAILFPFLTPTLVYSLLAFSAGIMVYISLDEILPTAQLYGKQHFVILGVLAGMLIMAISIFLLR
ncbi:MAG TPA: zinc transporter ZupT [Dehalococcoidia bacterium]|jgi:ZIP family zinc transporter|nr:zinc transporter ZupT [Dehalococcoidia bacterium]